MRPARVLRVDGPGLDQAEAMGHLDAAGGDIGGDARARQTLEGVAQAAGSPSPEVSRRVAVNRSCAVRCSVRLTARPALIAAISWLTQKNQDVLVMDRRTPP